MSGACVIAEPVISVTVERERLLAYLCAVPSEERSQFSAERIQEVLAEAGIALDVGVRQRVAEFLRLLANGGRAPERFLVALGKPAVPAREGGFEWSTEVVPESAGGKRIVLEGTVLGRLIEPIAGVSGLDVFGEPIEVQGVPGEVGLGANVRLLEDGATVESSVSGTAEFEEGQVRVIRSLVVGGDVVSERDGTLDVASDVYIRGTIRASSRVISKQSITVEQGIESAEVRAVGDVVVGADAMDSTILTEGRLVVESGSIVGGDVYARKGAVVGVLGGEDGVGTRIRVGASHADLVRAEQVNRQIEYQRKIVADVCGVVAPLRDQAGGLSVSQRLRADSLLDRTEILEEETERLESERVRSQAKMGEDGLASVLAKTRLHRRVTIAIGNREAVIGREWAGPVRIVSQATEVGTAMVLVDERTGEVTRLDTRATAEEGSA